MIYLYKPFSIWFHFLALQGGYLLLELPAPVTGTLLYHEDTYHENIPVRIRVYFMPKDSKLPAVTINWCFFWLLNKL